MPDELIRLKLRIDAPTRIFKKSKAFFRMGIKQDVPKVKAFKASESRSGASPCENREKVWSVKDCLWGKKSLMQSQVFATGGRAMMKTWRDWRIPSRVVFSLSERGPALPGFQRTRPTKDPVMSDTARLIHAFPKNPLEEIRVSLTEFKKKQYIDLRVYYKGDDGEYHPSKKGITVSLDLFPDLVEAIEKARELVGE